MAIISNGTTITIAAGNQIDIGITPFDSETGKPYMLSDGEKVVFSVRQYKDYDPVIRKESDLQGEDGAVAFYLSADDTNVPRGSYCWMADLVDSSGDIIDTFIGGVKYAAFYVK